jgi:hypothetical protein
MIKSARSGWICGMATGLVAWLAICASPPIARGGLFDDGTTAAQPNGQGDAAQAPVNRPAPIPQPMPNGFQIAAVEKLLRQVYGAALDGKSPGEMDDLARKLFDEVSQSDDPAEQWVLLREARDRAARAGDAPLAFETAAAAQERFDFDPREIIGGLLTALSATERPTREAAAAELQFGRRCFVRGEFALAARAIETARAVARACHDQTLAAEAEAAAPPVEAALDASQKAAAAVERLKSRPHDGTLCEQVGRYDCFTLGRWHAGLGMLTQAGDTALEMLAPRELERDTSPSHRLALADAWLQAAGKDRADADAEGFRRRAEYWYRLAIEQLDGLPRLSAEKSLRQLATGHMERGVTCELFNGRFFERRLLTRSEAQINFPWGGRSPAPGVPPECFSARFTGWIKPPVSGEYKITLDHDDGGRLWIDGSPVIDKWVFGSKSDSATIQLSAEYHDLRLEYMQGGGPSHLKLLWSTPGDPGTTPIPPDVFFHEPPGTPGQLETGIEPDADGTLHLTAAFADVHGAGCRYVDADGSSPAIAGLLGPAAYASWDVVVPDGTYVVELTCSCDNNAGGEYLVTIGPAGLRGMSQDTGGWNRPKMLPLGAVKLSAGSHRVTVRSITSPHGREFHLNEVTLRPRK